MTLEGLQSELRKLHKQRLESPARAEARRLRRRALTPVERATVLKSTGSKCHLCGGPIATDQSWQADHVLAHSGGGAHTINNYLPAHTLCNNYRWAYLPDEFQLILKLGVWVRTQVERGTSIGIAVGQGFTAHERRRESRRRLKPSMTRQPSGAVSD
jgi:hypothetical protein